MIALIVKNQNQTLDIVGSGEEIPGGEKGDEMNIQELDNLAEGAATSEDPNGPIDKKEWGMDPNED